MEIIIIKSVIISLAIVGLRVVSSRGMILYFLRMPYEWLVENEVKEDWCNSITITNKLYTLLIYLLKPIIGCCVCMASVYTIAIDYYYYDLSKWTVLTIFMVATLNSIIFALYEKIN